ncbi:vitamin K-dependent gamma-carboxylase-like [Aphomia sociella]
MYLPKDSSSLAVTRILFGGAMLFDIPDERGGAMMEERWGDTHTCHFPLIPFVKAIHMPYMAIVYAAMWLGALGIMLGYKYRLTSTMFTICYWYLFLIEKSFWNNHSYLFGLTGLLLACTEANSYWSIDTYLNPTKLKKTVPYWNYFVLKYQFFILYFMAGVKKGTAEWLTGYSVQNLSEHWVFGPFKLFLTIPQIDYIIVHWFIFVFDLTIAIWMMWSRSRHIAMIFCALFHLMNSRLFRIGMFPWVCLATMPLYYPFDWPKVFMTQCKKYLLKIRSKFYKRFSIFKIEKTCQCKTNNKNVEKNETKKIVQEIKGDALDSTHDGKYSEKPDFNAEKAKIDDNNDDESKVDKRKKITVCLILFHVLTQAFLPFSHFITKGYNNWTDGLYGYSWDMMVHTWDTYSVVVKVVDNEKNKEFYVDPQKYTLNDRWTRHGDMVHQYAWCLKKNLINMANNLRSRESKLSKNLSIYVDIWCSLNGRFAQRMFDSKADILKASWSPFTKTPYLIPLVEDAMNWRRTSDNIRENVRSWNNYSDVMFLVDFPGYVQEKYIPPELYNVTLTVLKGDVVYEPEVAKQYIGQSYRLTSGNKIKVASGYFHKILNIADKPSYYMYTFYNSTDLNTVIANTTQLKLPIGKELIRRFKDMVAFGSLIELAVTGLISSVSGDASSPRINSQREHFPRSLHKLVSQKQYGSPQSNY